MINQAYDAVKLLKKFARETGGGRSAADRKEIDVHLARLKTLIDSTPAQHIRNPEPIEAEKVKKAKPRPLSELLLDQDAIESMLYYDVRHVTLKSHPDLRTFDFKRLDEMNKALASLYCEPSKPTALGIERFILREFQINAVRITLGSEEERAKAIEILTKYRALPLIASLESILSQCQYPRVSVAKRVVNRARKAVATVGRDVFDKAVIDVYQEADFGSPSDHTPSELFAILLRKMAESSISLTSTFESKMLSIT